MWPQHRQPAASPGGETGRADLDALLASVVRDRAAMLARQGQLAAAGELLAAVAGDPGAQPSVLDLLARVRAQQGRLDEAAALWRQALVADPGNQHYRRALALCAGGDGRTQGGRRRRWAGVWAFSALVLGLVAAVALAGLRVAGTLTALAARTDALQAEATALQAEAAALRTEAMALRDEAGRLRATTATHQTDTAALRAPPAPGQPPPPPRPAAYVVRPGDTLWSVAADLYGMPELWRQLAAANGISDPYRLRPGDVLAVPEIVGMQPGGGESGPGTKAKVAAPDGFD